MPEVTLCAICHKRKPKRHCPGVRGEICAVCCGTEREVSIDCPFDCIYLHDSRRYDWKKAVAPASLPFPEVEIGDNFLAEFEPLIGRIGYEILHYCLDNPKTSDRDVQGALASMVKTYETLSSGIYYESLPEVGSQIGVFRAIKAFFDEVQKKQQEKGIGASLKEQDVIRSLVFLARLAAVHDNQRPRGKAFIDFLRQTYPGATAAAEKQASGLIVPGA